MTSDVALRVYSDRSDRTAGVGPSRSHEPSSERGEDLRQRYTLRECYERYVVPDLLDMRAAEATYRQYRTFLTAWERITGDPGVGQLTAETLRAWKAARSEQVADKTVDKEIRMLRRVLAMIGPKTARHRQAAEILLPWPPDVKLYGARAVCVKLKRPVSPVDWAALYHAARGSLLSYSAHIPGPLAMQSAIVAVFSTGLREGDLFRLSWGHVFLQPPCPVPGFAFENEHGWLWLSAGNPRASALKCAGKTHKEHVIPLTRSFRIHLERMRAMLPRAADTTGILPLGTDCESDRKMRNTLLHAVNHAARIVGPRLTWHPLRLGANEAWNLAHFPAGKYLLQHAMRGVNEEFYTTGLPSMLAAIGKLQEPFDIQ